MKTLYYFGDKYYRESYSLREWSLYEYTEIQRQKGDGI